MICKLEAIQQKYDLTIQELSYFCNKICKDKLRIKKNAGQIEKMILKDLRLYIIANDTKDILKSFYGYTIQEREQTILTRFANTNQEAILKITETIKLIKK